MKSIYILASVFLAFNGFAQATKTGFDNRPANYPDFFLEFTESFADFQDAMNDKRSLLEEQGKLNEDDQYISRYVEREIRRDINKVAIVRLQKLCEGNTSNPYMFGTFKYQMVSIFNVRAQFKFRCHGVWSKTRILKRECKAWYEYPDSSTTFVSECRNI